MDDSNNIIYFILVPIFTALIPIIYALFNKEKVTTAVTAVNQYILEELKADVKDLKERIRTLELLSPGSLKND